MPSGEKTQKKGKTGKENVDTAGEKAFQERKEKEGGGGK